MILVLLEQWQKQVLRVDKSRRGKRELSNRRDDKNYNSNNNGRNSRDI